MLNIKRKREARDQDKSRRKRAVIYLRETDDETSFVKVPPIGVQRWFCHREARELDADVIGEFDDVAGTSPPLPGMVRLLERLDKTPQVNYLIVYSLDRLVPECEGAFVIGWHLGSNGTTVVSWAHVYESEVKQQIAD